MKTKKETFGLILKRSDLIAPKIYTHRNAIRILGSQVDYAELKKPGVEKFGVLNVLFADVGVAKGKVGSRGGGYMRHWKLFGTICAVILLQACAQMERNVAAYREQLAAQREQQEKQREVAKQRYLQSLRDICANSPGPGAFEGCMRRQHEENLAAQAAAQADRERQAAVEWQLRRDRQRKADRAFLRAIQPPPTIDCTSMVSGSTVYTNCQPQRSPTELFNSLVE